MLFLSYVYPFLFNLHCSVRLLLPGDLHVYDASVNIVSLRASLPDNTVFIVTDWPHMSSKHCKSHVRAHCIISSIYLVTILNRKQDRPREDEGGVEKQGTVMI